MLPDGIYILFGNLAEASETHLQSGQGKQIWHSLKHISGLMQEPSLPCELFRHFLGFSYDSQSDALPVCAKVTWI